MVLRFDEADNQLQKLVERAAQGEEITITRSGQVIAKLIPVASPETRERPMTLEELREFRKGHILGPDLTIKQLIEEGRRF